MIKKPINQNEERYITKSDRYQISATSSIKPLDLPFGEMPENLLPVLEVDGIIVNVGEYRLISQATLDTIKESNNPHYDIKDNGEVKGKKIGQTIPSITIDMDKLSSVIKERDIQNRIAGVTDVEYVTEGALIEETLIPLNLIQQINYTLNQDVNRPMDTYTLAELQLSDESNYDLTGIEIVTRQSDEEIFDNTKLEVFLADIKTRMQALGKDFDTIKDIHYSGLIPNDVDTFSITKMATAEDVQEADDFQIVYKSSKLVSVKKTPIMIIKDQQVSAINNLNSKLQETITAQEQALAGAQAADSRTQKYIQQQLDLTRAQLQEVQNSLQQ